MMWRRKGPNLDAWLVSTLKFIAIECILGNSDNPPFERAIICPQPLEIQIEYAEV
jgi:hypothetical protein